jgi:signal transduction histidine kinase/ligand-binding sensor domain-containing protein
MRLKPASSAHECRLRPLLQAAAPLLVAAGLWTAPLRAPAASMASDYLTDVWTAENGLPYSSVTALNQTPDGYLWVGTYNGLARFNGIHFVTFDPANTPALTHARVRRLFVDAAGTLWINSYDGSLTTYRQGHFTLEWTGDGPSEGDAVLVSSTTNQVVFLMRHCNLFRKKLSAPPGKGWDSLEPPNRSIGALCCEDNQGNLWYRGGRDRRLWRLPAGASRFDPEPIDAGLADPQIRCMLTDARNQLWVGTDREIAVWRGTNFVPGPSSTAQAPLLVGFLSANTDGSFWTVAGDRVRQLRNGQWSVEAAGLQGTFSGNLTRMGAQEDHHGGVWLYDFGRGLFHVSSEGQYHRLTPEDGFPGDRVGCFFEDREGNWWAGLDPGGLIRIRERRFQTIVTGDGAATIAVRSICEDSGGAIWIGTLGGGLDRWQSGYATNLPMPGGTAKGFVFSACPDHAGRLWVSAGNEDLFVYEHEEFKRVVPPVHGVKTIITDHTGRVWAGTKNGLYCNEAQSPQEFKLLDGTDKREVRALCEDKSGALWIGAGDGSLYHLARGAIRALKPPDSPRPQSVWALLADDDGSIWAGTFRGGLLRLRDGVFTRYGKEEGLPDNVICQLLDDSEGYLWLGSQQGISRIPKQALNQFADGKIKSLPCTTYGRADGLPSLECSGGYQPAAWRGLDGRLWFSTLRGVASIQPRELRPNLQPPPVIIEDVLIDGKSQVPATPLSGNGLRKEPQSIQPLAQLEVPPGRHQIELRFAGLSFTAPDGVQFRYRLENADAGWILAGSRRTVQYNFLQPGGYRFQLQACNSDGIWNESGTGITLNILPHFYETWWFRSLAALAFAGAIAFSARRIATRRLRRKLQQLQHQQAVERERSRIAKDIHDDLGAGLTQITLLSELARGAPGPESEVHLSQISDAARELTRGMDEIVWAIDPQNDTLDALTTYVCKFAQDYLKVAGIRCRLDLPEQLPPYPLSAEARHHLFLAVKEALNNVVKHAHATEAHLRLSLEQDAFTLAIQDNGQGFAPGGPASQAAAGRIASGRGLGNLERRLAAIGGACKLTTEPGGGTRVEFTVKFSPAISPVLASPRN